MSNFKIESVRIPTALELSERFARDLSDEPIQVPMIDFIAACVAIGTGILNRDTRNFVTWRDDRSGNECDGIMLFGNMIRPSVDVRGEPNDERDDRKD